MIDAFKRHLKRRAFNTRLTNHIIDLEFPRLVPVSTLNFREAMRILKVAALERGWTPEMLASIAATICFRVVLGSTGFAQQRAALRDYMYGDAIEVDPYAEYDWLLKAKAAEAPEHPQTLDYRFRYITGMMAGWMVKDRTIDIGTKALWTNVVAYAAAGQPNDFVDDEIPRTPTRRRKFRSLPGIDLRRGRSQKRRAAFFSCMMDVRRCDALVRRR